MTCVIYGPVTRQISRVYWVLGRPESRGTGEAGYRPTA
jgi:hypothetical protein